MPAHNNYPYRVFLSYDRDDGENARLLFDRMRRLHLRPIWDHHTPAGWPFLDEIKKKIDHSHVFIPFLTPNSKQSEWVNHEIGYAMGRNVPVLPLSLGPLPDGMARELEAVVANDVQALLRRVTLDRIKRLVKEAGRAAVYEYADLTDTRTDEIIKHCKQVEAFNNNHRQPLRHVAAFGSFTIPADPHAAIWKRRDGNTLSSLDRRERLSKERRKLEAYVKRFGCDLVLYPTIKKLTKQRIQTRKELLQSFLHSMQEANAPVRVAFDKRGLDENLIIVGDWFLVESFTPRDDGYRHTTITTHAPTVLKRIEAFDRQFEKCNWLSPEKAIRRLEKSFRPIV
jgi:hypothetical protein